MYGLNSQNEKKVIFACYTLVQMNLILKKDNKMKIKDEQLNTMSKQELGKLMNDLQRKVDSGRHTGSDVQALRKAFSIYLKKYENGYLPN